MDPLSIATGVITFVGACNALASTIKKLHHLRKAPKELEDLEDEITALRSSTESIGYLVQAQCNNHNMLVGQTSIGTFVDNARKKIQETQQVLENSISDALSGRKIRPSAWLRWESEFARLRQELRDIRSEIGTCISLFNA